VDFTAYDTRLAAYAVVVDADRILLSWFRGSSHEPAGWSLPGGGADLGESAEDTVRREVLEETGYDVVVGDVVATQVEVTDGWVPGRPGRAVKLLFAARVSGGELGTLEVDGSTTHAAWVPLDEVHDQPTSGVVRLGIDTWRRLGGVRWV
jgi:ADP-ribose pyrophosphatase YjhB (NUDIX family)